MKRILISTFALIVVLLITIFFVGTNPSASLTQDQVKETLKGYIQTGYLQATGQDTDIEYEITAIYKPTETYLAGDTWCIHITPPQPMKKGNVYMAHFVISFSDPRWTALGFEESNKNQWTEIGCKDW
ncbi:MAG: hypothetical protein LCI00_31450 [Chloroflexi bacterium]|nr:hypothetical protein [Chloroflexota bacterium]MCC6893251.1 hypothetical protein [Anaerolineae bacterium]